MPRQSRGSAPPARRPVAAPARPAVTPPQPPTGNRSASTVARPPANAQAPHPPAQAQASQGPGLFGQMASTAAGVAVGSSIGHAIGGFFGGGSSAAAPAEAQINAAATPSDGAGYSTGSQYSGSTCTNEISSFRKCMNENGSDLTICGWYLDQLKACQAAASQY